MNINELNDQLINQIEDVMGKNREWNSIELDKLCRNGLGDKFNSVVPWSDYIPNTDKAFSIVNTDNDVGVHWVSAFFDGKTVHVYDSFGRSMKRILKNFIEKIKLMGYKIVFCNKRSDQAELQINCGLRSFVFLFLTSKYGIKNTKNI